MNIFNTFNERRRAAKAADQLEALRQEILFQPLGHTALYDDQPQDTHSTGIDVISPVWKVAQHPSEMSRAAAVSDRFVRAVRLDPPSLETVTNLGACLRIADDHLERLADNCGARVVEHTWGLAENQYQPEQRHPGNQLIPEGHMLVAMVESVQPILPLDAQQLATVEAGIQKYTDDTVRSATHLRDLRPSQFAAHPKPSKDDTEIVLLDIDARFR